MALQSKITVYVALAGVFAMMGGIVYYASLDNAGLEQVEIELSSVTLKEMIRFIRKYQVINGES